MPRMFPLRTVRGAALAVIFGVPAAFATDGPAAPERTDYLTFAQGAVPLSIGGAGAQRGANFEHAVRIIDGSAQGFTIVTRGDADTVTEFIYELPAATIFDRLAVPQVLETPSPSATFTRVVEVHGSSLSATAGYQLLASATLAAHQKKGATTELELARKVPVRWVKLKLSGGIHLPLGQGALEFSEIVGNGAQEPAPVSDRFKGIWKQGSNVMALSQHGAVVSGCYDRSGDLEGTVSGSILRATGLDRSDRTTSAFILSVTPEGALRGVRSANGGPFRFYAAPPAAPHTKSDCAAPAVNLGCGSIVHGINFDFDSAMIRAEAEPILQALYAGLRTGEASSISIEGHTSSEGSTEYNRALSEKRARAVVADLSRRGIAASRLSAVGIGELRPIAGNGDENGRAMNRRVEVVCK